MVRGQRHVPAALYPREKSGTHCTGGEWALGPVWTGVENFATTGIRSPDRLARSQYKSVRTAVILNRRTLQIGMNDRAEMV